MEYADGMYKDLTISITPNPVGPKAQVFYVETFDGSNKRCRAEGNSAIPRCEIDGLERGTEYKLGAKACVYTPTDVACSDYTRKSAYTFPDSTLPFKSSQKR